MRRVLLLGALALSVAGCTTESALPNQDILPFKSDPTVSATISACSGNDVTLRLSATHFTTVDPATADNKHKYGEGHFHVFLDVPPTAPGEVTPRTKSIFHTFAPELTMPGLSTGRHHADVVLGYSDHTPYQSIGQTNGRPHGTVAALDFNVPCQATAVAEQPSAAPTSAASAPPSGGGGGGGSKVQVIADAGNGGAYNPTPVKIKVGDSITWDWVDDSASHTVTADDNKFDSGLLQKGGNFTQKFTSAGTVKYHCSVHPAMLGQVVVS